MTHASACEEEEVIASATGTSRVQAAVDSGSVDNVIHPNDVPQGTQMKPNERDRHFVGANNSKIENYGTCVTTAQTANGAELETGWTMVEVSRPLHSVSKICGPIDESQQDVLFNNKKCVIVPPGVVDRVLQYISPLMQYDRKGGLYVADLELRGFTRPGVEA